MLQRIQTIFNRLAGLANFEAEHLALAHTIFAEPNFRFDELESPAYLRRKPRVIWIR
jgi:hypothetical protein